MEYLVELINAVGYYGYAVLFLIIFLESFPLTFFLPGDSLLFTTGFLASQGHFELALLVIILCIAAFTGYYFSYVMGEKIRNFILNSNDAYWFKKKHLDYTEEFYQKYGAKTVIFGRFIPIVRSFGPTLAGAVKMERRKFTQYNVIGSACWAGGVTTVGFYIGRMFPTAHMYLTPVILGIIFVSFIPSIVEYVIARRNKKAANAIKTTE